MERETGALAFYARAPLQLSEKSASDDLSRIDAREIPSWADAQKGSTHGSAALSFRYIRPGWKLELAVDRFSEAAVL